MPIKLFFLVLLVVFSVTDLVLATKEEAWLPRNLPEGMPFSGAVGAHFRIRSYLKSSIVKLGDFLELQIEIKAKGKVLVPPSSIYLEEILSNSVDYKIELFTEASAVKENHWSFCFKIWPKAEGKIVIPELPLAYINPEIPWKNRQLMIDFTNSLEVEVLKREVFATEIRGPNLVFDLKELRKLPWMINAKTFGLDALMWIFLTPPFLVLSTLIYFNYRNDLSLLNQEGKALDTIAKIKKLSELPWQLQAKQVYPLLLTYLRKSCGMNGLVTGYEIETGILAKFLKPNEAASFAQFFKVIENHNFDTHFDPTSHLSFTKEAMSWILLLEVRR